jgi:hypothetical protein
MAPVLEGKSIGRDQKTVLKGELLIWRTKNQARDPQVHSNSRIQFASHSFLGNWTPGPSFKVGLMVFYCKTLLTPYVQNHSQHDWHLVQSANMLDPKSEALSLVKASKFLLIFGFLTCFVLWCPRPSLLFVKELGKPVINGQAERAPSLIRSSSWMSPSFPQ